MRPSGRRQFLKQAGRATAAGSAFLTFNPVDARQPLPPTNLRAKDPVKLDNLTWKGTCHTPVGGFSYSEGKVALRYVNGERRLLTIQWHVKDATHGTVGNLTELRLPALATDPTLSAPMTVVRQWANWNWEPTGPLVAQLANGWHVGGLWWDEEQQVLWYTLWPYYAPSAVMPFLAAVTLRDDGTVTKHGPWHYVSSTSLLFRKVCQYFVPIPPQFRSMLGGRRVALGAGTLGASGGSPTNWGPGLTAIHLPPITSTAPVEAGVSLMDYSPGAGGLQHPYFHCRRESDYFSHYDAGAIPGPKGNEGFWQSSADMAIPAGWIDSAGRSGLLLLGQRTSQDVWYGLADSKNTFDAQGNMIGRVPVNPPDTMALDQGSTGYHSNGWQSAAWLVRTEHLEEVAKKSRKASADGMRPELLGPWHTRWPQIPRPSKRPYVSQEGMVIDTITNEMIWVHGISKLVGQALIPTVHVVGLP